LLVEDALISTTTHNQLVTSSKENTMARNFIKFQRGAIHGGKKNLNVHINTLFAVLVISSAFNIFFLHVVFLKKDYGTESGLHYKMLHEYNVPNPNKRNFKHRNHYMTDSWETRSYEKNNKRKVESQLAFEQNLATVHAQLALEPEWGIKRPVINKQNERLGRINRRASRPAENICSLEEQAEHPQAPKIILKGERHCGTNWIDYIIQHNAAHRRSVDSHLTGWKHGFLYPVGFGMPLKANQVLIIITRDVFTWLPKMYGEPYDDIMKSKIDSGMSFSEFIRTTYEADCHPNGNEMRRHRQKYMDHCKSPMEKAENIIQIRTDKYKNWLSMNPDKKTHSSGKDIFIKNRSHLRLESLVDNGEIGQEKAMMEIFQKHCVPVKLPFEAIVEKTNWGGPKKYKGAFDTTAERDKMLAHYSQDDLQFVLSQLDMDFEKDVLGYNYDYVHKLLNS